jgi:alpha-D-xyloside xylohydrolase
MVRPNAVILVGASDRRPDYDYSDGLTLHVFELEDGATSRVEVPASDGEIRLTASIKRTGAVIQIELTGNHRNWQVLLRGIREVQSVAGGGADRHESGTLLTPEQGSTHLVVNLKEV